MELPHHGSHSRAKEERTSPWPCLLQPPPFPPPPSLTFISSSSSWSVFSLVRESERESREPRKACQQRLQERVGERKRSKAAKAAGCSDAETREKREGALTFEYRSRAPGSPAVGLGTSAWRDRGIIFSSCLLLFWGYVKNILHLVVYYHALAYQGLKK